MTYIRIQVNEENGCCRAEYRKGDEPFKIIASNQSRVMIGVSVGRWIEETLRSPIGGYVEYELDIQEGTIESLPL